MNALGGPYVDAWRAMGEAIGKPKGVVMVSAHWETRGLGVTAQAEPGEPLAFFNDMIEGGSISMTSVRIG